MNPDCNQLNPLQRDGRAQDKRLVHALHPSFVKIDERNIADLLAYARDYARLVQYYSLENNPSGDWRKFIESDVTSLVAMIVRFDLQPYRDQFAAANDFQEQFAAILALLQQPYEWLTASIEGLKLHRLLERMIQSVLEDTLTTTIAYAKRMATLDGNFQFSELNTSFVPFDINNIQENTALFPDGALNDPEAIQVAQDNIQQVFQNASDAIQSILQQAPDCLAETLEAYHEHQPHMALFLAFLQLFQIAQKHLNSLTKKHLDFYYQEVLQIPLRAEKADEVHLVFELAKNFANQELTKDTLLKAGKDAVGANLFFGVDQAIVLNRTQRFEDGLKSIFIQKNYHPDPLQPQVIDEDTPYEILQVHAAPKANSVDGLSEALEEHDKWLTFGDASRPEARIGFAISSPLFLMREGQRRIRVTFHLKIAAQQVNLFGLGNQNTNAIAHELMYNIQVQYSGEAGWETARISQVLFKEKNNQNIQLQFDLYLAPEQGAFVGFDSSLHQPPLTSTDPVLYFSFRKGGLAATFFCAQAIPLVNLNTADTDLPDYIRQQILDYFNAPATADAWEQIAAFPIPEWAITEDPLPNTPLNAASTGYTMAEAPARQLIQLRNTTYNQTFTSLAQLATSPAINLAVMNDLFYTFCAYNKFTIDYIRSESRPFEEGQAYSKFAMVTYEEQHFYATQAVQNIFPNTQSGHWQLIAPTNPYRYFQAGSLEQMDLTVEVKGMKDLVLENDVGTINTAKPFLPFGPIPKVGSKFYIGKDEVFQKPLDTIELDWTWADLPGTNFDVHYDKYALDPPNDNSPVNNASFTVDLELLYKGNWLQGGDLPTDQDNFSLFTADLTAVGGDQLPNGTLEFSQFAGDPQIPNFSTLNNQLKSGFIRLVLQQDFLHKQYPKWVARAATGPSPDLVPDEPYTPTIGRFELSYSASKAIVFSAVPFEAKSEHLFHIAPFGWQSFYPNDNNLPKEKALFSQQLVPQFLVREDPTILPARQTDAEGTLYIGLKDLQPEQNVSILFQMAEGSADPDLPKQLVHWSYLSHNHWIDFDRTQVLSDTTNDLLTSGIVTLTMPKTMTTQNTILPAGVHWIKVSVARQTNAVSQSIAIYPQALKASFRKTPENDLSRLATPLPAQSIGKLKQRQASIKSVQQPFSSFNGQLKEQNETPPSIVGRDRFN
ncbi:MAG: hypothetical protein AAGD05_01445, partial [Bacteroidota bacterium]